MESKLNFYLRDKTRISRRCIDLVQPELNGGRISKECLDTIKKYPKKDIIVISGLTQESFEYFIAHYGNQFMAIHFWKCPQIKNLSKMSRLSNIQYVKFYWNTKAERLWDFSCNPKLSGLSLYDFSKLSDLSDLSQASNLQELFFGDVIDSKTCIESLDPVSKCMNLKLLEFDVIKINDERIDGLAELQSLSKLNFPGNLFSTVQIAWLKSKLNPNIDAEILNPFIKFKNDGMAKLVGNDILVVGSRKPGLCSKTDRKKLEKYIVKFNDMYNWFCKYPDTHYTDYL